MKKAGINKEVVILASGDFPRGVKALHILESACLRICCDGSAAALLTAGWEPDVIIGDMDSLSLELQQRFADRIVRMEEQDSNDLTKAVRYCSEQGHRKLNILGATGMREDHSLGNISLLTVYAPLADVRMLSDYGEFFPVRSGEEVESLKGEQISIFSLDNSVKVSSEGLRYPLQELVLSHWYTASLNEALGDSFRLFFSGDYLILYRSFS